MLLSDYCLFYFRYIPDEIRGDMDSIRPDVRAYYESKCVKITRVGDQNSTDFMKCVSLLNEKEKTQGQIVCLNYEK